MSSQIEAGQAEFTALSKLQIERHTASHKDEPIESIFTGGIAKRTWYSTFPCQMESDVQKDTVKFKVSSAPHYLAYVYLVQKLPALRVKKSEEENTLICWPHNCGNNVTVSGGFTVGNSNQLQSMDCKFLDDFCQIMIENGYEDFIKNCQGNFPFLEEWSTFLPEYPLTVVHPYFFTVDTDNAFPIFRIDPKLDISFKYKIRNSIKDLLRMKRKIKGEWKEIEFNMNYIEGNLGKHELPNPEMWGIYFRITQAEIDSKIKHDEGDSDREKYEKDNFEQIIYDVLIQDKENDYGFGSSANIQAQSAYPSRFITIKAEDINFSKCRNYSNYTTHKNVYEGWSPIKHITLNYGPTKKIEKLPSYHTSRMMPFYHCNRVPYERGYNVIPFCSKMNDYGFDTGVMLSNLNASMSIKFKNTDPMLSIVQAYSDDGRNRDVIIGDEEDRENDKIIEIIDDDGENLFKNSSKNDKKNSGPKYKIITRIIISKTLVFQRNKDSEYFNVKFKAHENS